MTSEADGRGRRLTRTSDPYFSTSFAPARSGWTYTLPLATAESRTVWDVLHDGPPERAMDAFYATALADVPAGPSWLHDVTWQHYDYMSRGGRGWYADLDALAASIPLAERGHVVFTLHGWFDVYGRYAYDAVARRLVDAWTVFPNAANVRADFPDAQTIPMTKADVHRRIAYARDLGFRVAFYFADGMATGEDVPGLFAVERTLYKGGWQGPDTTSPTWTLNPLHPDVRAFFEGYLDALLAEYGREIDALVWDETFHVRTGTTGPASAPGYADRAVMLLTRELARRVTAFRPELAFLTSDTLGMPMSDGTIWTEVPPSALVAHGTYQDSNSRPEAWRYGVFPNFRNTLWSCNWRPQTYFDFTRYGVEQFNTPVATSNGHGDILGIADLDAARRAELLALHETRKRAGPQRLRWLPAPR
jgi:hypothetical protein